MKKVVYSIEKSAELNQTMRIIELLIPCFVSYDEEKKELEIECREYDVPFVERMLAPYV